MKRKTENYKSLYISDFLPKMNLYIVQRLRLGPFYNLISLYIKELEFWLILDVV
mgnify:CR=1|jgi:hypothetical protein|nr:MAG TPA: hypothetical protein [Caudoviricetes sp.]